MQEPGEPSAARHPFRLVSPQGIVRVAVLVALCPIAGWFGAFHWTLDLFNHLQAQYFCFLLLATIMLAAWRKTKPALVCAILLMLPAARLAPLYLPADPGHGNRRLRVSSYNILGTNTCYGDAVAWIRSTSPDFIYLPETNEEWGKGLSPLADLYPHGVDEFVEGNFGSSFRSKYPITRHKVHRAGDMGIPLLELVVATPMGEVTVFGAHPVPPVTSYWAGDRDTYLKRLSDLAAGTKGHLVILGDLNATRWSHCLAPLFAQGIRDSADGQGFSATWMRENILMAIPIDHILTRHFSGTASRTTGPETGSDHRPIVADLVW